jgi:hypothetical protein
VLLVDGGGAVIASKPGMYDQGEQGGGFHEWGRFLHFAMILWANKLGVGQSDIYTRWERGRSCSIGHASSVLHERAQGELASDAMVWSGLGRILWIPP